MSADASRKQSDYLIAAATVAIWTGFLVLARLGVKQSLTAWDLIFLRFGCAALLAGAIAAVRMGRGEPWSGQLRGWRAISIGVSAGLGFTCLAFIGYSYAPAAHGAVLMPGTLPMWTALLGWWILRDPIVGPKRQGLALIVLGVVFMAFQAFRAPHGMVDAWKGDLVFPLASLSWSIYVVNARRWGVRPLDAIIVTPLVAFVLFAPLYVLFAPKNLQAASWAMILGHGVFQGCIALTLSMWLFGKLVIAFGPVRTTMITALAPPLAAVVAVPVLDEPLTLFVVAGLLCVVAGTVIGVRPARPVQAGGT